MFVTKLFYSIVKQFKKSIRYELFFIFVVVISIPIVFFISLSYRMASSSIEKDFIKYKIDINSQIIKNIDENTKNLTRQSMAVYANLDDLALVLNTTDEKIDTNYLESYNRMSNYFQSVLQSNDKIDSIALIDVNGKVIHYLNHFGSSLNLHSVQEEKWFKDALSYKGFPIIIEPHVNEFSDTGALAKTAVISIARAIINLENSSNKPMGVLVFDQSLKQFQNIYENIQTQKDEVLIVTGKTGNIIYSNKPIGSELNKNLSSIINNKKGNYFDYYINKKNTLVTYAHSLDFEWNIISLVPYTSLQSKTLYLKNIYISLLIAVLVLGLILSFIFTKIATSPLEKLTFSFKSLQNGDFSTRIETKGENEFSQIVYTFNNMVANIQKLIKEKYEMTLLHKQAELTALQNQINPHFLYNTLTSIKSVIDYGDSHNASLMIESLSDIFRYCLNKGTDTVEFQQELDHIQKYLYIQKLRFGDKFHVFYDIDEDVMHLHMLRLTLQPIVENAIYHGFESIQQNGELRITAKLFQNKFYIYIYDNGVGIPKEKLEEINSLILLENKHVPEKLGIHNVNARIRNYFGDDYGLKILSTVDVNTTVKIILPTN